MTMRQSLPNRFSNLLFNQFPYFARPGFPIMRHTLTSRTATRRGRLVQAAAWMVLIILALFVGAFFATDGGATALNGAWYDKVYPVLYWPTTIVFLFCRIFALTTTLSTVEDETKRGTWDTLKVTSNGANLLLRTRWAAVFVRIWIVLTIITLARLFFSVVAVLQVGTFQGGLLDLLLSGTVPFGDLYINNGIQGAGTPPGAAIFSVALLAVTMTAGLILPFTALAFDAALGTYVGTFGRGRVFGILGRVTVILLRIGLTVGLLLAMGNAINFSDAQGPTGIAPTVSGEFNPVTHPIRALFVTGAAILEGDVGLTLMNVDRVGRVWADLQYGALIGIAALVYALFQIIGAHVLVLLATRRAAKAER